mgnify:CR=1 FL=1
MIFTGSRSIKQLHTDKLVAGGKYAHTKTAPVNIGNGEQITDKKRSGITLESQNIME